MHPKLHAFLAGKRSREGASSRSSRIVNLVVLPVGIVLSWLVRGYAVALLGRAEAKAAAFASALSTLPLVYQLMLAALVPLLALEVWFVDIRWVLYGSVWRTLYPDLVLTSRRSSSPNLIGRAYRTEANADGSVTIYFAQRGRGVMQRFHGLQRLHAASAPKTLGARQVALEGEGIERTGPGEWRVSSEPLATHALDGRAAEALLVRPLKLNQLVTKEGLEGNPYHLSRLPQSFAGESPTWERDEK
jgi:hypothetical protein